MPEVDLQGPQRERFKLSKPFEDPDGLLALSPKQLRHLGGWKRPSEFMKGEPKMINMISAYTITQDLVSDCSFVASMCITAAYERRFKKQLITKIIYPQDRLGVPIYNPSGKYLVKLQFNGVTRKVIVDDRLPIDKRGEPLCSFSNAGNELWVSIIEKAYMKLNGGYDFPGSNSGIDLFCLTGWVPEHFRFDAKNFDKQRTWERLMSGYKHGDCLITIATGKMTEAEEEKWGLVQTHAYAVLGVREVRGIKLLQVKNPWAHKRWKGAYSAHDNKRWTPYLCGALQYDPKHAQQFDNGIFWIDYDSMLHFYRSIYFNWNPDLFACKARLHASWNIKAPGPINDSYNIGYNPQYALRVKVPRQINGRPGATAAVWIVLSRHVVRKEVTDASRDREGRIGAGGKEGDPNMDYLALHVYPNSAGGDGDGEESKGQVMTTAGPGARRKFYPRNPLVRGVYTNNPHTLIRMDCKPGTHDYTLVVSQYKRLRTIDYSVHVFSMAPVNLGMARNPFKEVFVAGAWTAETSGGNPRHPNFFENPQYALTVPAEGDLMLRLEAPVKFASNVRVVKSGGRRALTSKEVTAAAEVASSGDYRHGFCCAEKRGVGAGTYTVIVSSFKPGCIGPFKLIVGHTAGAPGLKPIGAAGSGLHRQVRKGAWRGAAAAGSPNHNAYGSNPTFRVHVPEQTSILFRIKTSADPTPSMNASLFAAPPSGRIPNNTSLASAVVTTNQGVYSNPPGGVLSSRGPGGNGVELRKGQYLLVVSTFKPQEAPFELTVWTSHAGVVVEAAA